jgi:isopenicillin N synthase-like dioxygenase
VTDLPIIDIGAWRHGTAAERDATARATDVALRDIGFLLIENHGVRENLAASLRSQARLFFELDSAQKSRYTSRVGGRGWIPPGAESNSYASGVAAPADLKETFKFGMGEDDDPETRQPNVWPSETADLQRLTRGYLGEVWELALDMFCLFECALGLPASTLTVSASAAASSLNINYYPSLDSMVTPQEGQFRIGPHSDFGVLTILDRQPGYGGLQIRDLNGIWTDAPHVAGTLTVNVGDMLARWTGDLWRSTVHRVLPPSEHDSAEVLMSLVNFCGVRSTTLLETLPVGGPTSYQPILAGEYMRERLSAIDLIKS